ncbi:CynX/NimT family MFS transporter [Staphylococcus canis]|uniref:MFS transporter n=1 Tax=Staphylococcus canis TaxID=2724942 RepID=A0ABS0T6L3_9STAP|nr:MFS transporter [Staphylococcus canis]MBI5974322.1 MFS transporter [Staphylococcus canis]
MQHITHEHRIQDNWLLVIGIVLVASTLRAPLTAVGPIIEEIKMNLDINNGVAGMITTIPLIIFGIVSPLVSKVMTRISMSRILFYALILTMVALIIRVSGNVILFFVGTILLGIAIAFANVTLPAYAKWRFPLQIGVITGIYSATMNLTAGLGGGLSYPLSNLTPLGYRFSLVFWLLFAGIALIVWISQIKGEGKVKQEDNETGTTRIITSKMAWAVALTMAFQSMIFYSIVAWYPSILVSKGIHPEMAGYFLMLNQFSQLPMTFTFPIFAAKMNNQRNLILIIVGLLLAGFALLFTTQTWSLIVAMILTGMGIGACFSICMTFFSIRARTTKGSLALSGFGQSVGYLVAAVGPFALGVSYDMTHGWVSGIIMFMIMALFILGVGLYASQPAYVEDK